MRLRTIFMMISALAVISITAGGFYYFYSLRNSAISVAHRRAAWRTESVMNQISGFLSENLKPVKALAGLPEIYTVLDDATPGNIRIANLMLDHFQRTLDVDVCYIMNRQGDTICSSNRNAPDSFVGQNFSFRPYFKQAIIGDPSMYLALGTTSGKRGAYYSHPVYKDNEAQPLGVVVIKAPIRVMEKNIIDTSDGIALLVSPEGVIFSSNRKYWLYQTMSELTPEELSDLSASRQFGRGPWTWVGLDPFDRQTVHDQDGHEYFVYSMGIDIYPGWKVIQLLSLSEISESVFSPLVRSTSLVVLPLCLFGGLAVYYLFRKANLEIMRRQTAENDLRKSEERYRSLYHNTPAMLHSIDGTGKVVSVSDYWSEALGYTPADVVGRPLTDFMTEESRNRAVSVVMPAFFRQGECKDINYQFIKKQGDVIDVLLSAIAEKDSRGNVIRSLAVLVDITERKRAEEELKLAQEKLSNHSRELEKQVRQRTREITSFLQYTPAVVYIKDADGRYIMVNSRYEELFGHKKEEVIGKTVHDVFPPDVADQFRRNDQMVLRHKRPYQAEDRIPMGDDLHWYLSVRFPLFDETGEITRVCGISVNITDLKQAQQKLRRLSGSIITNQEKERTAIARELHDELGQVLTALRMDAVWLKERLAENDVKASARAMDMCELIDSTITEVGSIATRLRPAVLDDLGLIDALEWYTTEFEKRTGLTCLFKHAPVPSLKEVMAIAIYRITQEALTNVARHAQATHVDVNLNINNGRLTLRVEDDGRGFDPNGLTEQEELGLAGMRERAYLIGGDLLIKSVPGKGTSVRLTLPTEGGAN
jgi:PAS domain S-box-containing protein